jgi:hypothetical protein
VWVEGEQVVKLCLRPNFHVAAGLDAKRPTEISIDLDTYRSGDDGRRSLSGSKLVLVLVIENPSLRKAVYVARDCTQPVIVDTTIG